MAKTNRIGLKVTLSVYETLRDEAEKRGVAISALCAWLCGDWVAKLKDQRELAAKMQERTQETVALEMNKAIATMIEENNQMDIEDLVDGSA